MSRRADRPVITHVVSGDLWAGAEVQVYNLCRALKEAANVEVTAITFNKGVLCYKLRELGIPVDVADETSLNALQIISRIRAHCQHHGTTVLHTHGFKENVLGVVAKTLCNVPRSVRTVHGNPETAITPYSPIKWLVLKTDQLLGRTMQQAVVAVSSQLEDTLSPLFPGKVHKIYNFVDIKELRDQQVTLHPAGRDSLRLGIAGRLVPVKRVDIFLQTIALLKQKGIRCSGVVIGTGPLEPELKELATRLNIAEQVEFRGFVEPVYGALKGLDMLIMPSDHEGLPMILLEALALEIPIVAHDVGGIPEVLADGDCGWLVEDHTPEGYAATITKALQHEAERKAKSNAGLQHAQRTFGAEANIRLYEALYGT